MPPTSPLPADADLYPCSDGQPMAESDVHIECITCVLYTLKWCFEQRGAGGRSPNGGMGTASNDAGPDVYVAGNLFLYYERGNPKAVVAPDVFVVRGAPVHKRDSYLLWNEPKGPDFVLEVTSKSTKETDLVDKRAVYASLGVEEYFLYDPRGEYLRPPLQGYRLEGDGYRRLSGVSVLPGGGPSLYSAVLELELRDERESQRLRLHDPATGQDLRTYREAERDREAAERGREAAEVRVEHERARNAELEARLRVLESALASSPGPPKPSSAH